MEYILSPKGAKFACYTPLMPGLREVPDEPPPFLGTWPRVYLAVLIYLIIIIASCYAFTRALE